MGIQRYRGARATKLVPAENGEAVLFADHVAHTAALVQALVKAKETIRALHGEAAWDIYDRCSPEMKIINAALDGQP